jgi:NADP-dependent 3-hydroxy acid dehydrogenase YdfG
VFATARKVEKMAGLADHIQKLRMDVTSDEDILQAVQEVIAHAGRVDVLVNNAGVESAGEPHSVH